MKIMLPKLIFKLEKWKWNEEYGVFVSNLGHFRSKEKNNIPYKILNSNGYVYIKTKHGDRPAHRLVMLTWCPIEDRENFTVDHLDHNKRNNAVDNLEWVTQYENMDRAKKDMIKEVNVARGSKQIISIINIQTSIKTSFNSLDEAIKFYIETSKITDTKGKATVKKKITTAITLGDTYGGYKWIYE